MSNMKVKKFVETLVDIAEKEKTIYAFGSFGFPLNEANKKRLLQNTKNRQFATKINNAASTDFAFDCVCYIKAVLWGWTGDHKLNYGGAIYKSNGVPDINADVMMTKAHTDNLSTDFNKIEYGHVVGMPGHIGVYIGNGKVAEATPKWQGGALISNLKDRKWVNHGKLKYVDYTEDKPAKKPLEEIAAEIWQGKWGNDPIRTASLKSVGYTDAEIKRIREIVKETNPNKKPTPAKKKAVIKRGAVSASQSKHYNGRPISATFIGVELDYELNKVKGKDWVYFPVISTYVDRKYVTFL